MFYIVFYEIKNVLKKYINSLNLKNIDYLIVALFFLTLMTLFKVLNIFEVEIKYIISFLAVVYVLTSFSGNNKMVKEYIESKEFSANRLYPISSYKLMAIKTIMFEILYLIEYFLISSALALLLIITGYSPFTSIFSLLSITLLALCTKNILIIFSIRSKRKLSFLKVIMDVTIIFLTFFYFHYLTILFNSISDLNNLLDQVKDFGDLSFFNSFFIGIYYLQNASTFLLLSLTYIFFMAIRILIYSRLSELKNKVSLHYPKIKVLNSISFSNIIIKKEMEYLNYLSFFRHYLSKIIAYLLFFVIVLIFDIKFDFSNILLAIIIFFELISMSEKITTSYLGKEKSFILHYIFSSTSIQHILLYKTFVHSMLNAIYITIVCLIVVILFEINLVNSIILVFVMLSSVPTQVYISNIFNTYKSSYMNDFGIPNKKTHIFKILIKSIISYITLAILTFTPLIFTNIASSLIIIISFLLLNIFTFLMLYIFTRRKEKDFYGEYGSAFSK